MADPSNPPLPQGFTRLKHIILQNEGSRVGETVNVVGHVKDFQQPIKTRGTDWKCAFELVDPSTEGQTSRFHIFTKQPDKVPDVSAGDVMVLFNAKVQGRGGISSLLSNNRTEIHLYRASKIPAPPMDASLAYVPPSGCTPRDMLALHRYVSFFHKEDKSNIPTELEFQQRVDQSLNIQDKFSLLSDVKDSCFYDICVQVLRDPWYSENRCTLWVSDYSENNLFFNRPQKGADGGDGSRDGDPHGYLAKFPAATSDDQSWDGPFGRRALQVTAWDSDAEKMHQCELSKDAWVWLRNVRMHMGKNGSNLEGTIHADQRYSDKVRFELLDDGKMDTQDEEVEPELKDCLKRKRAYERSLKAEIKRRKRKLAAEHSGSGHCEDSEHVNDEPPLPHQDRKRNKKQKQDARNTVDSGQPTIERALHTLNSKERRALDRAWKNMHMQLSAEQMTQLNPKILCESPTKVLSTIVDMLRPHFYTTSIAGKSVRLQVPWACEQYRADLRVVNFHPPRLENFARKKSEFDVLSDDGLSGEDDSDGPGDADFGDDQDSGNGDSWKWAFWLRLEDANPVVEGADRQSLWVVVNNQEAQCLLNLDATNLRRDPHTLSTLRERLFVLWGDLEILKLSSRSRAPEPQQHQQQQQHRQDSRRRSWNPADHLQRLEHPPPSSPAPRPTTIPDPRARARAAEAAAATAVTAVRKPKNRPFSCCVRQYGIKKSEQDPEKMDAGEGRRWLRVYGLFGTQIRP